MYPNPLGPGPLDDMDAASRREFSGDTGRAAPTGEPTVAAAHGNLFDKPYAPEIANDHQLSGQTMDQSAYRADPPTGISRTARGRDEDIVEDR